MQNLSFPKRVQAGLSWIASMPVLYFMALPMSYSTRKEANAIAKKINGAHVASYTSFSTESKAVKYEVYTPCSKEQFLGH